MPRRDLTDLEAHKAVRAAMKHISALYTDLEVGRGPKRTAGIYELLSEVRRISEEWRKQTKLSRLYFRKHLRILAGRKFKVARPPEFMLLRAAIRDRQVHSPWAKVAKSARLRKVPWEKTAQWIEKRGGIDKIIRRTIAPKK